VDTSTKENPLWSEFSLDSKALRNLIIDQLCPKVINYSRLVGEKVFSQIFRFRYYKKVIV
jgi:hypothetical protein